MRATEIKLRCVDFQARNSTHQTPSINWRGLEIYSMRLGENTIFSLSDTIIIYKNAKIISNAVKFLILKWFKIFKDYKNLKPSTYHRHL